MKLVSITTIAALILGVWLTSCAESDTALDSSQPTADGVDANADAQSEQTRPDDQMLLPDNVIVAEMTASQISAATQSVGVAELSDGEVILPEQSAQLLKSSDANFAMLLTDAPLNDQGVTAVNVEIIRVELLRRGFEGMPFEEDASADSGKEDAGKPDDAGKPEDWKEGTDADSKKPEDAGKPDDVGAGHDMSSDRAAGKYFADDASDDHMPKGRIIISGEPRMFNLLDLRNGITAALGGGTVPPGTYTQIRLVLSENNTIEVNGETKPLVTPSAGKTGLKIIGKFEVVEGEDFVMTVDFDAEKSIVVRGSEKDASGDADEGDATGDKGVSYLLKPVIKIKDFQKVEDNGSLTDAKVEFGGAADDNGGDADMDADADADADADDDADDDDADDADDADDDDDAEADDAGEGGGKPENAGSQGQGNGANQ